VIRDGYVAHWRGADYEANPGADGEIRLYSTEPVEGFEEALPGRFIRVVRGDEVENLRYVRSRCNWRGEPFVVIGEHDDWVRVEYVGGRAPVAAQLELERVDIGVHQTWVPREELQDIYEEDI
jgi:hypothetical protein